MMATTVVFAGFLFVDDTDLIAFSKAADVNAAQIIARLQTAVLIWHGGLRATGGALKPEKCSWRLDDFQWVHGQWRYSTIDETPGSIEVPDVQGALQTITGLDPSEAVKAMGYTRRWTETCTNRSTPLRRKPISGAPS